MTSTQSHGISSWLASAVRELAADLHVVAGHPPMLRINGRLEPIEDQPVISTEQARSELLSICPAELHEKFATTLDVDFSHTHSVNGTERRFRVNLFVTAQSVGGCLRIVPDAIPDFEWAGFPIHVADRLVSYRNGLILVSGVTGSGKSTTLAMLVDLLNQQGNKRIVTIEEPVEYNFPRQENSIITQREVGVDVQSFSAGLKYGLRQDPDVILVGEIRDRETAQMALTAAETGHLVFSTVHARDVKGVVSRYTDLFPQDFQAEIRAQLALSLRAVLCQNLLPAADSKNKRHLALEIMFSNSPIASAIRQGKLVSIDNSIQTGRSAGMVTMNDSVKQLYQSGQVDREAALRFVDDPSVL